jgi:hypothetical protein
MHLRESSLLLPSASTLSNLDNCKGTNRTRSAVMSKLSTRSKEVRFKERSVYICTISAKLIVTLSSFLHIVTLSSSLHNNRETVSSVECISGWGVALKSMIIMARSVLMEKHFNNAINDGILFRMWESSYSNAYLGMEWLNHF